MALTRIYHPEALALDQVITLSDSASNHLLRVLRARIGDIVILFNGIDRGEFFGTLIAEKKNAAQIKISDFKNKENESPLKIELAQAISRGEKMDFVVQKSVELGVHEITPLITERCNIPRNETQQQKKQIHWQKIAISAAEQSGRCRVPEINGVMNLSQWIKKTKGVKFFCDPMAERLISDLKRETREIELTILIGPEGGFSPSELSLLKRENFKALALGPRILRTETAPIATIAILQSLWGDW